MWLYTSASTLGLATLVTLLLMLWAVTRRNPFKVIWRAAQVIITDYRALLWVGLACGMLALNLLLTALENRVMRSVTWDFTEPIARFGTQLLLAMQRLESPALNHLFTFVYVILFVAMMLVGLIVYLAKRDMAALKNHVVGYWVNYLVALPFYLWFPVKEAWAGGKGIQFLIPKLFPGFELLMRPHSGLDNCFPSLHTSLALTYALVAWRQGYRRLALFLSISAGLVMLSTLYLGVHWVLDMVAGAALALLASGYLTLPTPATDRGRLPAATQRIS